MDAFEFNKVAAAVLTALLVIFGGKTMLQLLESRAPHKEAIYTLPQPKGADARGGADAAKFDPS